ncbi:MAG TPA: hypothetical protein DCL95_01030, partial [Rhodospirillaceae bacterium]|nr:hypothetical protein [Rhodospirillaceae bacterium]
MTIPFISTNSSLPAVSATVIGAVLIVGLGVTMGSYWTVVALNLFMWIALTQSWSLFSGMTGYISLGH